MDKPPTPQKMTLGVDRRLVTTTVILLLIALGFYIAVYCQVKFGDGGNPHLFIHPVNLGNLFGQAALVGILATGMTLVIVTGHIDLSVGSMLGMLGAIAAALMFRDGPALSAGAACGIIVVLGLILGALHGWLVAYIKIPAFVVTLGGLLAYRGVLLIVAKRTIPIESSVVNDLGSAAMPAWGSYVVAGALLLALGWRLMRARAHSRNLQATGSPMWLDVLVLLVVGGGLVGITYWLNTGSGVPIRFVVMIALAAIVAVVAEHFRFGRHLYAIGGNHEAAVYSGIPVTRHVVGVFALMGAIAALAGLVSSGHQMAADPAAGDLMELYAIAACVIGGTSLSGGRGSVVGSVLGAMIMATIRNGLSCLGVANAGEKIVLGVILVIAVGCDLGLSAKKR